MTVTAHTLMIQGTASHVGKSILCAAFCRLFARQGLRVAPFKAQNMSNNSCPTPDGKEIGRAQAVQAAACRLLPRTEFNPILIKPETDSRAQLVVNGQVAGVLKAGDFGAIRQDWSGVVQDAFFRLAKEFDLIVLEGAGSPAEVNLRDQDIVNMWMASVADAPVVVVGDIERGGVFASLVGTHALLTTDERRHVKGFLINKFRGDTGLLTSGVQMVENTIQAPCLGIVPYWDRLNVPQEDSLGWTWTDNATGLPDSLAIGVVDVPSISNVTDFDALRVEPDVRLVKITESTDRSLDAVILPGTKQTAAALQSIRARGIDGLIRQVAQRGLVVGICGGYQILGTWIRDPDAIESDQTEVEGLGLLDAETTFECRKQMLRVTGTECTTGIPIEGYEIHMGQTVRGPDVKPWLELHDPRHALDGAVSADGRVMGTYVHGLFDAPLFRRTFLNRLRARHGWQPLSPHAGVSLDQELDALADFVGQHVDVPALEAIVQRGL